MSDPQPSSSSSPIQQENKPENNNNNNSTNSNNHANNNSISSSTSNIVVSRRQRPARECTKRAAARLQAAAQAEAEAAASAKVRKKKGVSRKQKLAARLLRDEEDDEEKFLEGYDDDDEVEEGEDGGRKQCGKIVTQLVGEPEESQLPRWNLRSMWQLASILNFLNVFRPLLNIRVEFSAEEFETALISPNDTLGDIHMPLLKAIPPVTRMALGHNTWITVLCRKLRDWWHWVAEGELPIVAAQGAEIEAYSALDPAVRVVILKALCDIRVEQEDIRNYIDENLKQGVHLSLFRKERIGGDSHGISYWYEDDPIIGHRLYREIRKIEVKKGKGKNVQPIPSSCYQWETVATNLDEFLDVSEKLFSSKNRTEASVGKKLKNDMLPEVERVHKRKEKLLKKQHRQALMLDNMLNMDGLAGGRSLRDRKRVTYTFDDYDRSINEAIKITKNGQPSAEPPTLRREASMKHETSINGGLDSPPHLSQRVSFRVHSPKSPEYDEYDEDQQDEQLDRSNRRRQRPQRYSASEFVEALSENEADPDSDDDIMGEAVYDDEYLRKRKQQKISSSSEGDDEYHWDEENPEDEEEEDEDEDSPSASEESDDEPPSRRFKKLPGRTRRETKLRSVGNLQSGLRRSNRATRNRINYSHLEMSESETESMQPEKSNGSEEHYDDASDNAEFSMGSEDTEENNENENDNDNEEVKVEQPVDDVPFEMAAADQNDVPKRTSSPDQDDLESGRKPRFLDLNELAPGSGFDDGPNSEMKDEGADDF
ncbi:DDT domain-containing protein DDR4 [Lycium ferocissimum]|uniref:DDT domain-containing protein DDR4 n=1 Tax=Lycium ferocissimum TaxID=112874 RepID=UPI0028161D0C|nr:DDT domain-containing protein DDR4 [Lycium ferocissimum]